MPLQTPKQGSFSLVELMVVILVVAVLAASATPLYKDYIIRTNIAKAIVLLQDIAEELRQAHLVDGEYPSSLNIGGTNVPVATWVNVSFQNIKGFSFTHHDNGAATIFPATITGLDGLANYIEPTDLSLVPTGGRSVIVYGIRLENGVYKVQCGHYDDPTYVADAIPFDYLPNNCDCTEMLQWANNGTGC